ncbi:MAG TPA: UDP-N-acetylenolpyruvoylglucosamine reductase, partial [Pseudomonas sp.]|nr:UDP-N-acetylenolpyruvoylglucosamine reductase [Pseudomonas sp.]
VGLTALDRNTGDLVEFDLQACEFGYRDSLFKRQAGRYIILRVRFALQRTAHLKLEYGPLQQWLQQQAIQTPTPMDVSRAVCAIRSEKLPDPRLLGNAGSFFKNPLVPQSIADALRERFPDLVTFPQGGGQAKLAAGWLIERAGWKGYREGDAGVHRLQALVLVNYGQATGRQILQLARHIQADIAERFGVQLEIEPNVI